MKISQFTVNYSIYAHITPNGKIYIGMTGKKVTERWCNGKGYKSSRLFERAIEKYGWENIKHIVLIENLTKEMAKECEIFLIKKYKSNQSEFGYNLTAGGDGGNGYKFTEEQSRRRSEIMKGHPTSEETRRKIGEANRKALKGRKLPEEVKAKMRKPRYEMRGRKQPEDAVRRMAEKQKGNHYHLGHKHSEETRRKMSESRKGRKISEENVKLLQEALRKSRLDPVKESLRREKIRQGHLGKKKKPWSEEARKAHALAIQKRKEKEVV